MNNTTDKQRNAPGYKRGTLAKPKHERDTTKFKLIVWFNQDINGVFYTELQKTQNKNRKYIDSVDWITTPGGNVTRHDLAHDKLIDYLKKYSERIINAWILVNDFVNDKQYLFGKWHQGEFKQYIAPQFTHLTKVSYNEKIIQDGENFEIKERTFENKHVFFDRLTAPPLLEFKLKYHETL